MKEKIFRFLFEVLKLAGVFLCCAILAGVLSAFFNDLQGIISKIGSFIFISYLLLKLIAFFTLVYDELEIKRLTKAKSKFEDISLYSWTGKSDLENVFFL